MLFPSFLRQGLLAGLTILSLGVNQPLAAQDTDTTPPADTSGPIPPPVNGGGSNDSISFPSAPVNNILDIYEQLSGKHLIRDPNLNTLPQIGINAAGLNKADQMKLIEATLLLDGVVIVPMDEHTAKVIAGANKGQNPRSEGIKIYANAADLPVADEVVSYYMPLRYLSPVEAERIFRANAPPHAYGVYVSVPSVQAIILTESTSVIRQLISLKELIDVPPAHVVTEFIQLNRADAEKVADLLHKLLDQKSGTSGAADGSAPAGDNNASADNAPSGDSSGASSIVGTDEPLLNEHSLISGTAKIIPDTRSNEIIIVTRPVNLPFLRKLIAELDQPDIYMIPQRRPLKYVLAQDILPALEAALAQGKDEEDELKNQPGATNSGSKSSPTSSPATTSNGGTTGSSSASAITPPLDAPTENNVPTVITIGNTKILADNRSNSIIVFGSPDVTARVFEMIDQLDRKPFQVYLATVIGELTVTEGVEFGIDLLQKFQKVGQGGLSSSLVTPGTSSTGSTAVPEPTSLTSALGFPLPTGLTLYGAIGSTLDAYVRALESTDRFKIISRPSVYTTNNKLAVIASGSQVPVPSNITSGYTGSSSNSLTTTASVEYENVLLQLDIIPLINANHEVTLKIRQTNNTLGSNNVISGNDVPTINTQEINTEVTVPDKSTVVIGGLISDTTKRTTSGVPWLSDIPLLGYLFKDTDKSKERDELIIMIQPTVVETDLDQISVNETEKERTILGREAEAAAIGTPGAAPTPPPALPLPQPQAKVTEVDIRSTTPGTVYNSKTVTTVKQTTNGATPATPTTDADMTPDAILTPISASSTASPDVSNGKMPTNTPLPPSGKTP